MSNSVVFRIVADHHLYLNLLGIISALPYSENVKKLSQKFSVKLAGGLVIIGLMLVIFQIRSHRSNTHVQSRASATPSPTLSPAPQVAVSFSPSLSQSKECALPPSITGSTATVDFSHDSRTLGYTDSRKLTRDSASGSLYVAFRKKDPSQKKSSYQIFVAESNNNGQTWSLMQNGRTISPGTGTFDQRVPSLIAAGNTLHVAWYGADPSGKSEQQREIKYSQFSAGHWDDWRDISPVDGYTNQDYWQEHPNLAIQDSDRLFLVWEGKDSVHEKQQIKFSHSSDGGKTWSNARNVLPTPNRTQSRPVLIAHGTELSLFAYSSVLSDSDNQQIVMTQSSDTGQTWSEWVALSDPAFDSRHVSAVVDAAGTFHIAYRQTDSTKSWITYRSSTNGRDWSSEERVAPSEKGQFFPSLGLAGQTLYLGWTEAAAKSAELPKEDIAFPAEVRVAKRTADGFTLVTADPIPGGWITFSPSTPLPSFLFLRPTGQRYAICYAQLSFNGS